MDARVDDGLARNSDEQTVMAVLLALSFSHLVNDTIQSLVPSVYPILKTSFALDFGQIGLITLAFQLTASFLQPVVGFMTDKRPRWRSAWRFRLPVWCCCHGRTIFP